MNLLDEIFSSAYKQQTNPNNNPAQNILDLGSLSSSQSKTTSVTPPGQSGGLFDMLSKPAASSDSNKLKKSDLTPLSMDTDSFGEYWTNCTVDEQSFDFVSKTINSPAKYFEVIKNLGNFFPIQIINDEAIATAKLRNNVVLIHATISSFNINILVKCYDPSHIELVANFLREII